jgi:hypothetical protein
MISFLQRVHNATTVVDKLDLGAIPRGLSICLAASLVSDFVGIGLLYWLV